jgi:cytochrome bd-type quinol oxidase subunit 1
VLTSLVVYIVAYIVIFGCGGYFMVRFLRAGPLDRSPGTRHRVAATAARPMSAMEVD